MLKTIGIFNAVHKLLIYKILPKKHFYTMQKSKLLTLVAGVTLCAGFLAAPAHATVISFEDVTGSFVPTSYEGLNWSGGSNEYSWVVSPESNHIFSGTQAHSGNNYAWSNGGTDLSISGGLFSFNSLWARIGNLTSGQSTVHGFLNGTETYTQVLDLTNSYQLFNLNFAGIDAWTMTNQSNNTLIDDITINASANNVPEPSSMALLGLGLVALAARTRRNKKAAI